MQRILIILAILCLLSIRSKAITDAVPTGMSVEAELSGPDLIVTEKLTYNITEPTTVSKEIIHKLRLLGPFKLEIRLKNISVRVNTQALNHNLNPTALGSSIVFGDLPFASGKYEVILKYTLSNWLNDSRKLDVISQGKHITAFTFVIPQNTSEQDVYKVHFSQNDSEIPALIVSTSTKHVASAGFEADNGVFSMKLDGDKTLSLILFIGSNIAWLLICFITITISTFGVIYRRKIAEHTSHLALLWYNRKR